MRRKSGTIRHTIAGAALVLMLAGAEARQGRGYRAISAVRHPHGL